jgi:hypothetical protein
MERISGIFAQKVIQTIQQTGVAPGSEEMEELEEMAKQDARLELYEEAKERIDAMKEKMDDQFLEGGLVEGFSEFITDLSTYPAAFLKGPVVRRKAVLKWAQDQGGVWFPSVEEELVPTYERVDPFRMYPEPGITNIRDGYNFEHHRMSTAELSELIDSPGYDNDAIRAVLAEMGHGSLINWLWSADMSRAPLEEKHNLWMKTDQIDALEFHGKISGKLLLEWGMSPEEVPDPAKHYNVNAWMIGRWVIKATLNYDALGNKPYYKTSFFKIPGAYWGTGIPDTIADIQQLCNAAARALANNMGIASGPQVEVNIDRIPADEDITAVYPWKVWQVTNDPLGSGQPAVRFTQPDDRSQALIQVYTHFLKLADDQSGIPAYVTGDSQVGGAGRTASGLSMLMGSAGKGIRQVVIHIDTDVIGPIAQSQYNWNMRYLDDDSLKGDAQCAPKGAVILATREQLNARRVEFLTATANPIDAEIIGIPGRATILREVAKGLSMPVNEIVPSRDKLEIQEKMKQMTQAQQPMAPPGEPGGQGGQQAPPARSEHPGGMPQGGRESNTVSNQFTGQGA